MSKEKPSIDAMVKAYVELHSAQHTMRDLAEHLAQRVNSFTPDEYLAEIRAMMGSELTLTSSRTVAVRR